MPRQIPQPSGRQLKARAEVIAVLVAGDYPFLDVLWTMVALLGRGMRAGVDNDARDRQREARSRACDDVACG